MAWKGTIAGVDQTANIGRAGSRPTIELPLNERATARFACKSGLLPARFADVVLYAKDGVTPLFGGLVLKRTVVPLADPKEPFWTDVECGDYFTYLDWAYVSLTYTAPVTLKAVITAVIAALPGSYGIALDAGQVTGPTIAAFTWERKRASDAIRELSDRTGYIARVSPLKKFKMFVPGTDAAPFVLSAVGRHFSALRWADVGEPPANKVTCICGPTGTALATQRWTANGVATAWVTDIAAADPPPPLIYVDNGIAPILTTVGAGGAFEWDRATHTLSVGTYGVPAAGVKLVLGPKLAAGDAYDTDGYTAIYPFEVTATTGAVPVVEAQRAYPDIVVYAQGVEQAAGLLAQLNQQPRELDIASLDDGWAPGQALTVALTAERAFNAAALITGVAIALSTENVWRYGIRATESATYTGSYLDQWRQLAGGGASGVSVVGGGGSGGGTTTVLSSPVYMGGSYSTLVTNPVAKKLIPNAVPYVAPASFTGRLRVNLHGRTAIGMKAIISDGAVDVATGVVTSATFVDTSAIVAIVAGHTYWVYLQNTAAGDGAVGYATLEAA